MARRDVQRCGVANDRAPIIAGSLETDLARLRSLDGAKWRNHEPDVLAAWVADMDLEPAAEIRNALNAVIARGDFGYNFVARDQLTSVFAERQLRRHGWEIDPDEVHLFCDVLHGIATILWLMTEPGDGIVVLPPIYPPFRAAIEGTAGREIIDCPLDHDGWRLNADTLRGVITPRTKVLLMCNPHNPTGRVFDDDELAAIAAVCDEHDLLVISDEVWAELVHPGAVHRPFAPFAPTRTVTMSSASKSFSLAGLRCAVAHVAHEGVRAKIDELPPHLLGAVSTLGATATLAAWTECDGWLADTLAHLTAQRDHLAQRLSAEAPHVEWQLPDATYLAWLDISAYDLGEKPTETLLEQGRVALTSGHKYGPGGGGSIRVNFATTRAVLDAIVDRTVAVLNRSAESAG